ncbi:NADH-quinone oxidoreductase subunit N [Ferruginibacter yonginensis]|uniref:NADH-quinone oxidoreductase subunit N n=1 Tax=Ferruginibacter yonginensis TaxID=1310416 RepID=A0ABV8QR82_9BACT
MNAILLSAIWGVIMMFSGVFVKSKTTPKYLAIVGIIVVFIANALEINAFNIGSGPLFFNIDTKEMLSVNSFNLAFIGVILICTLVYFLLNGKDIEQVGEHVGEYFGLIFFVLCGASIVATYNTLLLLFLGIEILSIPLYILTGSDKRNLKSNEASLKYFLMGAFSTGILLMGIAFIYGGNNNGSFFINNIQLGEGPIPVFIAVGLVFLIIALSFKVSAAPFHFWTPDVYDGAPTVFTSFMSTIVKVAGFFAFVRLFENSFGKVQAQWQNLIVFITVLTLFIGNITAVFQQSVKRMLAYSSIAQAGFMMLAVLALNERAKEGLLLYAAAYSLATIGIFAVLIKMKDFTIDGFNGLAKQQPLLALCATVFLLSLTGVPLTAGFQSKFFMLMAAAENTGKFWVIIVAVIFAAISAYYYFKVIIAMYFKDAATEESLVEDVAITTGYKIMLVVTAALVLIIGINPELVVGWMYH